MSSATIPFQLRRGLLPFCADDAVPPSGAYDYVALTPTSGDAGFSQAIQLWWFIERLTFTPTGTCTRIGLGNTVTFTKTMSAPLPDTTDLGSFVVRGAVTGNVNVSSTSFVFTEPAYRICDTDVLGTGPAMLYEAQTNYGYGTSAEFLTASFHLVFESGEWRLYYKFSFYAFASGPGLTAELLIGNPALATGAGTTGTFTLFGLTLNWAARYDPSAVVSGIGLTATDAYVTPL